MLRFQTAGESHGQALVAILSGLPAGVRVDFAYVDRELKRRMGGYGRGGRMKIESDTAQFLSGIRHGQTIGSPITVQIENRDWGNWKDALAVEDSPETRAKYKPLSPPRPGHADLAGCLKFNFREARYVLERASARETAARVAAGTLAKIFLKEFGMEVASHVTAVGQVALDREDVVFEEVLALRLRDEIVLNCVDAVVEARMKEEVDRALEARDTVGGTFEVVARGVPPGLGSCAGWDERSRRLRSAAALRTRPPWAPACMTKSVTTASTRVLRDNPIAPVAWKVESPTARISWCEVTSNRSRRCAALWSPWISRRKKP